MRGAGLLFAGLASLAPCLATASPLAPQQDVRTPALGLPASFVVPKNVSQFVAALESDTTGYYLLWLAGTDPRKTETFLRAAQRQWPRRRPWAEYASVLFQTEARQPQVPARAAVFSHALVYLQEWYDLTAEALKKSPADKALAEALLKLKTDLAMAALEAGDLPAARKHATEALASNTDTRNWNYGNVIHEMNQILGRVALREGKRDEAKHALLAAGATPGSPQLRSYGPHFVLAHELLDKGEKAVVIQYLDLVGKFWGHDDPARPQRSRLVQEQAALLAKWKAQIRAGQIPTDGQWR